MPAAKKKEIKLFKTGDRVRVEGDSDDFGYGESVEGTIVGIEANGNLVLKDVAPKTISILAYNLKEVK